MPAGKPSSGPVHIGSLVDLVLLRYGYLRRSPQASQTQGGDVEYVELSTEAETAFERYQANRAKRSKKEREAEALKKQIDEDRDLILAELGECKHGTLPSGTNLVVTTTTQNRKPQPARTVTWQTIQEV